MGYLWLERHFHLSLETISLNYWIGRAEKTLNINSSEQQQTYPRINPLTTTTLSLTSSHLSTTLLFCSVELELSSSMSKRMRSRSGASWGVVERTKVTVERMTTARDMKAYA